MSSISMPATGGIGTLIFIVGGLAIMLFAVKMLRSK